MVLSSSVKKFQLYFVSIIIHRSLSFSVVMMLFVVINFLHIVSSVKHLHFITIHMPEDFISHALIDAEIMIFSGDHVRAFTLKNLIIILV